MYSGLYNFRVGNLLEGTTHYMLECTAWSLHYHFGTSVLGALSRN
jgi:hypothetical protein